MMKKVKRLFGVLIIVCLLTLLPFGTAMAGDSPVQAQVNVLLGFTVTVPLPTTHTVSSEAQAMNGQGNAIPITPDTLSIQISAGKAGVILPLTLAEGQTLASFIDPVSGVELSKNKLTIPLKDPYGNKVISIVAEVEKVERVDNKTKLTAKNVVLSSAEFSLDLSSADEKVSQVSAYFEVDLKSLPQDASIKTSISKDPARVVLKAFELAALSEGNMVTDVAYLLNIEKANLENSTDLGEATITMKVGQAWAERYGVDKINILRYSEEGECQILPTTFIGYEDEQAIFQAISPDGLSAFGLTAFVPLPAITINWIIVIGGAGGGSIIIGSLILSLLRRRRAREAALKERWPTGLRPEDWELRS